MPRWLHAPTIALLLPACGAGGPGAAPPAPAGPPAAPAAATAVADEPAPAPAPAPAAWAACGPSACQRFAAPAAALGAILEEEKPLVVGFGEAHAQKGTEAIASTAARTTAELLPVLAGRASDVVLEIWIADGRCGKAQEKKVAERQKEVTAPQAESNTNEYVALAERAKALAIQPHVLRPSCEDVERVTKAGDDGVFEMLSIITRHMEAKVALLRSRADAGERIVLTYGGAMHNDLHPREGREGWSFGPSLAKATGGRYVEIDLVVPEYVKDTPAWTSQRWFDAWRSTPEEARDGVLAIRHAPHAYAVILPRGVARGSPGGPAGAVSR